ncbi:MAG: metal-sensitive transcriptional regulator [Micrococcales bacterium]|nr:metal-sensitive transcriptional regulator [Micrococcales bacterium]MBT5397686.1 metal-sensitive transcriptional regulator [Micrococcales bacterium]MBT7925470.1 metal-sensitive transcriptional regulator [Micrococcales bacterium]
MDIPETDIDAVRKRLARAQGQLGGIIKMLDEGRQCTDVLTQMAAAQSAINRAAFSLIASGIANCTKDEAGEQDRAKLEKAFLALS